MKKNLVAVFVSALSYLASMMYYFIHSQNGMFVSFAKGVDWAHALELIEFLAWKGSAGLLTGIMGDMAIYPPASHWLVALLYKFVGICPLQGLQIVCAVFLLSGMLALAWHYALDFKKNIWAAMGAAAGLALVVNYGFGLHGLLLKNFFFPQMVSTSIAVILFFFLKYKFKFNSFNARLFGAGYVLLGTFLLIYVHPLPAIWFGTAAALQVLTRRPKLTGRTGLAAVFALGVPAAIFLNRYFHSIRSIAANDGGFSYAGGALSTPALYLDLAVLAGLLAATLGASWFWRERLKTADPLDLGKYSGLIAVILLIAAQWAVWLFGQGSPYAIKKWLPLLGMWLPYLAGYWIERFFPSKQEQSWVKKHSEMVLAVLVLVFFTINKPYAHNQENQSQYINLRAQVLKWRGQEMLPRHYPQFDVEPMVNYYLAIGVLCYPRDAQTMNWFLHGTRGEMPLNLEPGPAGRNFTREYGH